MKSSERPISGRLDRDNGTGSAKSFSGCRRTKKLLQKAKSFFGRFHPTPCATCFSRFPPPCSCYLISGFSSLKNSPPKHRTRRWRGRNFPSSAREACAALARLLSWVRGSFCRFACPLDLARQRFGPGNASGAAAVSGGRSADRAAGCCLRSGSRGLRYLRDRQSRETAPAADGATERRGGGGPPPPGALFCGGCGGGVTCPP